QEADFLAHVDKLSEDAFDDQCTGANPRYPLVSELRQLLLQVSTARRLLNNNAWISVAGRHFPRGSP
ncbi:hypothetical protein JJ814_004773, partial [Salmonella enterica]|nr:hypothetical protein [Salmonella enterica]